jgi:hypothetical protein
MELETAVSAAILVLRLATSAAADGFRRLRRAFSGEPLSFRSAL